MPKFIIWRTEYYYGEVEADSREDVQKMLDDGETDIDTWTLVNAEEGIQGRKDN